MTGRRLHPQGSLVYWGALVYILGHFIFMVQMMHLQVNQLASTPSGGRALRASSVVELNVHPITTTSSPLLQPSGSGAAESDDEADNNVVHVLYALSGNHSGFLSEFEVSLKSVLLNAPHYQDLNVHIMADRDAYDYLPTLWKRTGLDNNIPWWRNVIITTYNVQPKVEEWKRILQDSTGVKMSGKEWFRHSFGAYYRLFADRVLPPEVDLALYLDTDVVALANLAQVWKESHSEPWPDGVYFQSAGWCDGVMMLNVRRLDAFWRRVRTLKPWDPKLLFHMSDNGVVNRIRESLLSSPPDAVSAAVDSKETNETLHHIYRSTFLTDAWDLTLARDFRTFRDKEALLRVRPEAGLVHYNGGGASRATAFEGPVVKKNPDGIGLPAAFYRDLPWSWARFMGKSASAGRGAPRMDQPHHDDSAMVRIVMAGLLS